ncbi:MAG: membrane protein [uncultured bacterium]|nr:MAG: membrane protein [uncultured bacterium]
MLIWVPAAITLFVTQHWIAGLVLTLWGIFVVGTVDNIIKPILIGEKAQIHPLMSFLTILGGIFTMGLPGLIVAPYLLSLALTFLHIYKLEYKSILDR